MLYLSIINYSECEPATLKVTMKMQQWKLKVMAGGVSCTS